MREAPAFDLGGYLAAERSRVEAALARAVSEMESRLPRPVAAAVRHGVTTGGKRLRPILCVTAYRACGGAGPDGALDDLAATLELIHAYSLMHDDLPCMDDAELRRGVETTHRAHGEEAAALAGAVLIPWATLRAFRASRALGCDDETARRVARTLAEAAGAGGMVGGQWLDLEGEGRLLTSDALDDLHSRKTGALLAAALVMGARAARVDEATERGLAAYGRRIGLAFQITDDVLDATASAEVLGKNPSDEALDKSTYVSLHGLEAARQRAQTAVDEAFEALHDAGIEAPALYALAHYVVDRDR
jgi:geranylgeranyl pyrophosphate synthase